MSERRWSVLPKGRKKIGPIKLQDLSSIEVTEGLKLRRDDEQDWWPLEVALDRFPELKDVFKIASAAEERESKRLAEREALAAKGPRFELPQITPAQLQEAFGEPVSGATPGAGGKLLDNAVYAWDSSDLATARQMLLSALDAGLDSTYSQAHAHHNIGVAYASEGYLQEAVDHFLKTLSIYGLGAEDGFQAANRLMYIYRELGLSEEASLLSVYLIRLKYTVRWPHSDELRESYFALARSIFEPEGSVPQVNLAASEPTASDELLETWLRQGIDAFEQGDLDQAIAHFNSAIELNPQGQAAAAIYQNLAGAYYTRGDFDEGIHWFERSLKLDPNNSETLANFGLALTKAGDNVKALHILSRALGADAYNITARVTTGQVLKRLGKLDEAKMQLEAVIGSGQAGERAMRVTLRELDEIEAAIQEAADSKSGK